MCPTHNDNHVVYKELDYFSCLITIFSFKTTNFGPPTSTLQNWYWYVIISHIYLPVLCNVIILHQLWNLVNFLVHKGRVNWHAGIRFDFIYVDELQKGPEIGYVSCGRRSLDPDPLRRPQMLLSSYGIQSQPYGRQNNLGNHREPAGKYTRHLWDCHLSLHLLHISLHILFIHYSETRLYPISQ